MSAWEAIWWGLLALILVLSILSLIIIMGYFLVIVLVWFLETAPIVPVVFIILWLASARIVYLLEKK